MIIQGIFKMVNLLIFSLRTSIKIFFFLLFIILNFVPEIYASPAKEQANKYTFSICSVFKNERKNLKEWIEYHRLIGVDHIYLYDSNSWDQPDDILNPYIKQGFITLIQWSDFEKETADEPSPLWILGTKLSAYENAAKVKAAPETKWLAFLDIDEFLVPKDKSSFKNFLKEYNEYPAIILSQDCFDASNYTQWSNLVIESTEMISAENRIDKSREKFIFKPSQCEYFTWPSYSYTFRNKGKAVRANKKQVKINRYSHRFNGNPYFGKNKNKLYIDNRLVTEEELQEALDNGYMVEDQECVIFQYVQDLKRSMNLD